MEGKGTEGKKREGEGRLGSEGERSVVLYCIFNIIVNSSLLLMI